VGMPLTVRNSTHESPLLVAARQVGHPLARTGVPKGLITRNRKIKDLRQIFGEYIGEYSSNFSWFPLLTIEQIGSVLSYEYHYIIMPPEYS
jgi:hypothetical protein